MRNGLYEVFTSLPEHRQSQFLSKLVKDPAARCHASLSSAQRQLWFVDRVSPGNSVYNVPLALRFRGELDLQALRRAFEAVCARHEVLRSRFVDAMGEPVALVSEHGAEYGTRDLRDVPGEDRDDALRHLVRTEAERPFDLSADAPLRCLVITAAENDQTVVLTAHHIVFDGWSLDIVCRELSALYGEFTDGDPAVLPELPFQYIDFAAWEEKTLRERSERELSHWRTALAGAPAFLDMPTDHRRPPVQSFRGDTVTESLSSDTVAELERTGRVHGATPFMVFFSAYAAMLHVYSGQDDVLVGTAEAGRKQREVRDLVGLFVNTIVLRSDFRGAPTFTELLKRVRGVALEAYSHAGTPFPRIVESLAVERGVDRNPLFQAYFAYHPSWTQPLDMGGVAGESLELEGNTAAFDLDLAVQRRADGTADLTLIYATDLFDGTTAASMVRYIRKVLECVVSAPDTPLGELPVMVGEERTRALAEGQPALKPTVDCLHDFVERGVARTPDRVALKHGARELTYRELDDEANRLARRLVDTGVGPGVLVGVCLSRSPRLLTAIFAVLKAGGAYVPLDPGLPDERLAFVVEDSAVPMIVTERGQRDRLAGFTGSVVCLDGESEAIKRLPASAPPRSSSPDDTAYVLYTSGSTGRPKGVVVRHRSVVGLVEYYNSVLRPEEVTGVLASTPAGFDASVLEYFATLFLGGTIILVDSIFDLHTIEDPGRVTLVQGVPSLFRELLNQGPLPGGLTTIMLGGEPLPGHLARQLYASASVERVFNIYGVTECTVDSAWCLVDRDGSRLAMGDPLPGVRFHVLNQTSRPVPPGARGELYVAGPSVSEGYLNRPELTLERFLPDPFAAVPGERMYRTGDVVRLRPEGQLEYLGRMDRQVKVHGTRVEPAEIEACLTGHPLVSEATVVVSRTPDDDHRLDGYIVPVSGGTVPDGLREYLATRLPAHMVPSSLTALDAFPLTPNGKLAAADLPNPAPYETSPSVPQPPRDPVEERLLTIWRTVLGKDDIGVHDDFFALGGQSLLALRVVAQVKKVWRSAIPVSALFESPTVATLARSITERSRPGGPPLPLLREGGEETPVILIHGMGGGVLGFHELSRMLPGDRPVYGLDSPGLDGESRPLETVSALASHHLDRIEAAGLKGPVVLAGWSMGAAVGYEMALQTASRNLSVPGLVLLDGALGREDLPTDGAERISVYSRHLLASAGTAAPEPPLEDLPDPARQAGEPSLEHLLAWAKGKGLFGEEMTLEQLQNLVGVFDANAKALNAYEPQRTADLPGLYLAAEEASGEDRSALFDQIMGGTLRVVKVPGDHHTMLNPPCAEQVAEEIGAWLDSLGL